ncbi:hypothetical protein HN865_00440 [Candidatus Woesearchaeota archaeon]|jgi:hypothetical protein|nr:hypothetical protein [Candidatus Woesearchaeota archaeon]
MTRLKSGTYEPRGSLEERLKRTTIAKASIRSTYYLINEESKRKSEETKRIIYMLRDNQAYDI